ncbi:hypothetical protein CDD83_3958 [Cordyceps sp. RAO-2017]|nr:hypothetical protein CDD83_3958 [Cordyceps sp. RAO-2017]
MQRSLPRASTGDRSQPGLLLQGTLAAGGRRPVPLQSVGRAKASLPRWTVANQPGVRLVIEFSVAPSMIAAFLRCDARLFDASREQRREASWFESGGFVCLEVLLLLRAAATGFCSHWIQAEPGHVRRDEARDNSAAPLALARLRPQQSSITRPSPGEQMKRQASSGPATIDQSIACHRRFNRAAGLAVPLSPDRPTRRLHPSNKEGERKINIGKCEQK